MRESKSKVTPPTRWATFGVTLLAVSVASAALGALGALRLADSDDAIVDASPSETTTSSATAPSTTSSTPSTVTEPTDAPPDLGPTTYEISTEDQWYDAVAAAKPGDTLLLTSSIPARLEYRGGEHGGRAIGQSGTESEPITIAALPDVWIDPGDMRNNTAALDLREVDFVIVDSVNVRNTQFGIRLVNVSGSSEVPAGIRNSTLTEIGHSAIAIQSDFDTLEPSSFILIENNSVTNAGIIDARFGEGIYVGTGSLERVYQDESHDVTIRGNSISSVTAEAIDIKPGTRDILIEDNLLFDLAPIDGGAISAHYSSHPNPKPEELDSIIIRGNRIWNQNLDGVPGSNDWAIWVGHGGVTIEDNVIWGLRDAEFTRAIRVRALADFGPHPIVVRRNIFWTKTGVLAEGEPSGASNIVSSENIGPVESLGTLAVDPSSFIGPVPPIGVGGDADAGGGPGSAFSPIAE